MIDGSTRLELETVTCDLCGSARHEPALTAAAHSGHLPDRFTIVRCVGCGLLYQNPRPTPDTLHYAYPDDYGPYLPPPQQPPAAASASGLARTVSDIREAIARRDFDVTDPGSDDGPLPDEQANGLLRGLVTAHARYLRYPLYPDADGERRLLDIGCGTGRFLGQMTAKGWIADGLEMSPAAAAIAQQQTRGRVTVGLEQDLDVPDGTYDLVMMSHVLEHVLSPTATLRRVHDLLRPGGWFVAIVPNIASASASLLGEEWIGIDLPRHLYHFSPQSLRQMVESSGLVVGEVGTRVVASIWTNSLRMRRGRDLDSRPYDGAVHAAMQWLLAPLAHTGRGDVAFIRAQKPA